MYARDCEWECEWECVQQPQKRIEDGMHFMLKAVGNEIYMDGSWVNIE